MPVMAIGASENGKTLMIGLTRNDIMKLLVDEPISGSLETALGIPGLRLLMFFGDTEESIKTMVDATVPTFKLPKGATAAELDAMLEKGVKDSKH